MWCGNCQQDVPAVAALGAGTVHCARCQQNLSRKAIADVADAGISLDDPKAMVDSRQNPIASAHATESARRIQKLGRTLRSARSLATTRQPSSPLLRFDPANASPADLARRTQTTAATATAAVRKQTASQQPTAKETTHRGSQGVAWFVALLGATILGTGLGLCGWSLLGDRPDLWDWALFATLGGQGLLIVGLVLLLANLWTAARMAASRQQTLHHELRKLQRTADAIAGERGAGAANFYADLSRGASPELMLANLRGQIDQLSSTLTS